MPVITQAILSRDDFRRNPHALYLYADSEDRAATSGTASLARGRSNTCGIATEKSPQEPWCDADAARQNAVVDHDLAPAFAAVAAGAVVVLPCPPLGTAGDNALAFSSPLSFAHLQGRLAALRETDAP